jgi:hypothetical protein
MVGIREYMVTKNLERPVPIRRPPHEPIGRHLKRSLNHRLKNPIEGCKEPRVSEPLFLPAGKLEQPGQLIPVES